MPVRFIIGRAGTGKTRHCLDEIVKSLRDEPLDWLIAELESHSTPVAAKPDPAAQQPAWEQPGAWNGLVEKLRDLRLIYGEYCNYLGQDRLDPHRRLEQVLACVENCRLIQNS